MRQVGVAKIDITPGYPIRLSGYASRKQESLGVVQHLWTKALAIGSDKEGPAILITVDNTGVPLSVRNEVVRRLQTRFKISPERVALCSSHSHTAPCLAGNLPTLFGEPIPPEHQAHIDRYTRDLIDAMEQAAALALKDRHPAKLSWAQGSAGFAANRRTKGGPVDQDLPVMLITDGKDRIRAIVANYACHCTTLGGETNVICGDWAGYAQDYLESAHPGAVVLMAIGCGADANPQPRTGLEFAKQHGREIQTAVDQVLARPLTPIRGKLECRAREIQIPFDKAPTRAEWKEKAKLTDYNGYYAKVNLAKLDRGEQLPATLPYLIQTWSFDGDLAMVFLAGEVVVDYSLRLKKEFDPARLWINAYANDVPCYIPSERILKEGGYEGGGAMMFYDKPARLAPGIEDQIIGTVHELLPPQFVADSKRAEFPPPKSPVQSLAAIRTKPGLEVDLVAAEPLIVDPVAIDWGPDGRLWVVEMRDYPMGMDGKWKPGSRIKLLADSKGTGKYDKATVFLDGLPFATGITAWGKGALVCTAPDILYAEDTNGDGRADVVRKMFTGFATENYQARVNSLSLGLDNWIYGANGLLGGVIHGTATPATGTAAIDVDIRGRDFRMKPETGALEPASGLTQQGRARDDWGNWFGCDNSTLAWHYPIPDHYIRRNPYVPAPTPRVSVAGGPDPNVLHPISRTLERFNQPESANRTTSACGIGIYRDHSIGEEFFGNAFICEPVHNLVHRLVLKPDGLTFSGLRAADEGHSEFLASSDNWFRPVQARTGPDGALWVVDMYRFVIEHPRWIPPERLAQLDVRAGDDKGRIYRVFPKNKKPSPMRDLTKLSTSKLTAGLDTANGTERDRIHLELLHRADKAAVPPLEVLAVSGKAPAVRVQALCALDGLAALTSTLLEKEFTDVHPAVRQQAVRLSEQYLGSNDALSAAVIERANDSDRSVRYQVALSLGQWNDPRAGQALGRLAARDLSDPWMRAAILSSAVFQPAEILKAVLAENASHHGRNELIGPLISTAVGAGDPDTVTRVLSTVVPQNRENIEVWQLDALRNLIDALGRKGITLDTVSRDRIFGQDLKRRLEFVFDWARKLAADNSAKENLRETAIALLGSDSNERPANFDVLAGVLDSASSLRLQEAALDALKHNRGPGVATILLSDWKLRSPSLRQSCIDVLLTREEWSAELMAGLESGTVGLNEVSPANRQRLTKSPNPELKHRADALWKSSTKRAELLAKYQSATTLAGDRARGALTFGNTCATCHFLRGQGQHVGPDLAPLADKSPADFLLAILDPNAAVEPRFIAYNIETKDDRSLSGIVSAETATTLTLIQAGGIQEKTLRSDISEIRASGLSLMPEGLEQSLTLQDLADVIAYIKTSPRIFGSATSAQAAEARRTFLAGGVSGMSKVLKAADRLPYPSWMGPLEMPYCRQTDGVSVLSWQTRPIPADLKADQTCSFRLPAAMGFFSQPSGTFSMRVNGRPVLSFNVTLNDAIWQSGDGKVRMSYAVMENNEEDSDGVLLIDVSGSILTPGEPATFEVAGSAAGSLRWFGVYLCPPEEHALRGK